MTEKDTDVKIVREFRVIHLQKFLNSMDSQAVVRIEPKAATGAYTLTSVECKLDEVILH